MDGIKALCNTSNIPPGMTPDDWFAGSGDKAERERREAAIKVCRKCPLFAECRIMARQRPERFGIWGGETEEARQEHIPPLVPQCDVHKVAKVSVLRYGKVEFRCTPCRSEQVSLGMQSDQTQDDPPYCKRHQERKRVHKDVSKSRGWAFKCHSCQVESRRRRGERENAA